jgi:hypothetical protein
MHFSVKNGDYDSGIIKHDLDSIAIAIKNVKIVVAFGYTFRP